MEEPTTKYSKEQINEAIALKLDGSTYSAIARTLGVSRQRVQQLLRPPKATAILLRARADYACEHCRAPLENRGHIHHTGTHPDTFNDLVNLAYLCASCHMKAHAPAPRAQTKPVNGDVRPMVGPRSPDFHLYAAQFAKMGGTARALALTKERRAEIARMGANARWHPTNS